MVKAAGVLVMAEWREGARLSLSLLGEIRSRARIHWKADGLTVRKVEMHWPVIGFLGFGLLSSCVCFTWEGSYFRVIRHYVLGFFWRGSTRPYGDDSRWFFFSQAERKKIYYNSSAVLARSPSRYKEKKTRMKIRSSHYHELCPMCWDLFFF